MKTIDDRFYLPQPEQPFEGKVETRIGTLDKLESIPGCRIMKSISYGSGFS